MSSEQASDQELIERTARGPDTIGGVIQMSREVVATVAAVAARKVPGVHGLGRSRFISLGDRPTRGVEAEVGASEAALDLELIIEHGCDIRRVADELRRRVAEDVDRMTGRKVVEVNLKVIDIWRPQEKAERTEPLRRVR
jgi:uncharacterized alkaline shock family protein YloU